MTRAPFAVPSFWGICAADRAVRSTVVVAFEVAALHGKEAAIAWIMSDDRSVGGGWSEFAVAAFRALSAGKIGDGREATNGT